MSDGQNYLYNGISETKKNISWEFIASVEGSLEECNQQLHWTCVLLTVEMSQELRQANCAGGQGAAYVSLSARSACLQLIICTCSSLQADDNVRSGSAYRAGLVFICYMRARTKGFVKTTWSEMSAVQCCFSVTIVCMHVCTVYVRRFHPTSRDFYTRWSIKTTQKTHRKFALFEIVLSSHELTVNYCFISA